MCGDQGVVKRMQRSCQYTLVCTGQGLVIGWAGLLLKACADGRPQRRERESDALVLDSGTSRAVQ
jgi:hypothetical protein